MKGSLTQDSSHLCARKDVLTPAEMRMSPKAVLSDISVIDGSTLQASTGCPSQDQG